MEGSCGAPPAGPSPPVRATRSAATRPAVPPNAMRPTPPARSGPASAPAPTTWPGDAARRRGAGRRRPPPPIPRPGVRAARPGPGRRRAPGPRGRRGPGSRTSCRSRARPAGPGPPAACSESQRGLEVVDPARLLPGELLVAATEVPVCGGLLVDRPAQVEVADDCRRTQVEDLLHRSGDRARVDRGGAEGLDENRD